MLNVPSPIRFPKIRNELEAAGFRLVRISGSHHIFQRAGDRNLVVIPVHGGMVKPIYGRKIKQIIGGSRPQDDPPADT